jgi:hypothetical protein
MSEKSSNLHILELGAYTSPEVVEPYGKDWVNYGVDNKYFTYLIDRYLGSTTNESLINGTSNMIYGRGIGALDARRKPEQFAQMISLFRPHDLKRFIKDRKMLGMSAFQLTYKSGKVDTVSHFPMETLRPKQANEDGEIEGWFYHPDWANIKPSDKPKFIPSFGTTNNKKNEIYVLKPYVAGHFYFSPVDYQGGLPYAVLEEEVGDYLINDVKNGFAGRTVVNFNNGVPDEETQLLVAGKVKRQVTGALGDPVIVAFNQDQESATTVEKIALDNAPDHYQYLATECENKLIIAHRVTSPLLVGIKSGNSGLGNNADEIKTASLLMDNVVIRPYQDEVIDVMDDILQVNDIALKLYFKTLQPLDFIDPDNVNTEDDEEKTGVEMSADDSILDEFINNAEDDLKGYICIDERDVIDEDEEFLDQELEELNNPKPSMLSKILKFVSTGTARPNAKSEQDATINDVNFKVRYFYHPERASAESRDFCKKMINAKKLYRKEDIVAMSDKPVNPGWGPKGAATYDIFKYKGGGDCHHRWRRKTFMSTSGIDTKSPNAPTIGTRAAEIKGYKVTNPIEVSVRPTDMPNNGFLEPR